MNDQGARTAGVEVEAKQSADQLCNNSTATAADIKPVPAWPEESLMETIKRSWFLDYMRQQAIVYVPQILFPGFM